MKIAIVHEWFINIAGSEKVVAEMLQIWPDADLFAVIDFLTPEERAKIGGRQVTTTFIQRLPRAKKNYQNYLPLMPLAIEQLDLSPYDVVISSSHAVAKGVLIAPDQLHVCYVHSPIRYAWDFQHQYLREAGLNRGLKGSVARLVLHYMRIWDQRTANSVDLFVANSNFIARRITKAYRRSSTVIYPPVATDQFDMCEVKDDFYLTASRMVPYKRILTIIEAFSQMPDRKLVVIGEGPDFGKAATIATSNVTLLGYQSFEVLRDHMRRARAFVFAAEEDFGITPVEAQACGTPVIAFGRGGALETVRGLGEIDPTGIFFYEQSAAAIRDAVDKFEVLTVPISPVACRNNAERFSSANFRQQLSAFVDAGINSIRQ